MTVDDLLRVSELLRELQDGRAQRTREVAGLKQYVVAATLGVSPATFSHWEAGRRRPRAAVALRYARLLDALRTQACRASLGALSRQDVQP